MLKLCPRCKKSFPRTPKFFDRMASASSGLCPYCKTCRGKMKLEWRRKNRQAVKEIEHRRYLKRIEAVKARQKEKDPLVQRAHSAVAVALRSGRIIAPRRCSRCGAKRKLVAHHPNYNKPLAVEWVCRSCHTLMHNKETR